MNIEIEYENIGQLFASLVNEGEEKKPVNPYIYKSGNGSTSHSIEINPFLRRLEDLLGEMAFEIYTKISKEIDIVSQDDPFIDIFHFVNQTNSTLFISESLFSIEKITEDNLSKPIRTHLFHPTVVFLIGKKLLTSDSNKFQDDLADMLKKSKLGKDALKVAGFYRDPGFDIWRKTISKAWCIAALSHDIVSYMEPAISIEKRFYRNDFFKNSNKLSINSKFKILKDYKFRFAYFRVWTIFKEYFLNPMEKTLIEKKQLDHGQLLACFIIDHYYTKNAFKKLSKFDKLSLFLSLVMINRHNEWSKPENLKEHIKGVDPLSTFFCLTDLLAEMRFVWRPVKKHLNPDENKHKVTWDIVFWLPYLKIGLISNFTTRWRILFIKNVMDDHIVNDSTYIFEKSTGVGDDIDAKKKRNQYIKMLQTLNLASENSLIKVYCLSLEEFEKYIERLKAIFNKRC
jgi:hypothetical protein